MGCEYKRVESQWQLPLTSPSARLRVKRVCHPTSKHGFHFGGKIIATAQLTRTAMG